MVAIVEFKDLSTSAHPEQLTVKEAHRVGIYATQAIYFFEQLINKTKENYCNYGNCVTTS